MPWSPQQANTVNCKIISSVKNNDNIETDSIIANNATINSCAEYQISLVGTLGNPYICMQINKTAIKGMIDTGASRSVITSAALQRYLGKNTFKNIIPVDLKLTAANGENLKVMGQIDAQLQIGPSKIDHTLIVFENPRCEFLIGNDILVDRFDVVGSRYLSPTNDPNVQIPIHYFKKSLTAAVSQEYEIPAQCIMEISIGIPKEEIIHMIGLDINVEPHCDHDFRILSTLGTVDTNGKVRCLIENVSDYILTLATETEVATICLLDESVHSVASINCLQQIEQVYQAELSHDAEAEQELLHGNNEGTLPDPPGYDGTDFEEFDPSKVAQLDHLTKQQQIEVAALIKQFPKAFAKSDADIGTTDLITHKIDVTGVTPIADPYRPVPIKYEEEVSKKIDELLKLGVITEAKQSPWASNLVIVKKKDTNKLRICCDLRGPNSVSKHKNKWPIRSIESSFAKLANAKYVTSLDLLSAYWTIKMDEESSKVTAFYGPNAKHYQWLRMPFGLAAAPHTYCQLMSKVLHGLDSFSFFYFDDIVIFSQTFEEHLDHLKQVIMRFQTAGFKINAKKCTFLCTESMPIEWLGSIIKHGQVFPDPKKVEAIKNIPPPKSVKELQAFIGAVGFHRRHIAYLAEIINPLIELTKKKKKEDYIWTNEHQEAFERTKKALCSSDGLALPDVNKPFIMTTDSSNIAIGVCLSQINEKGEERICAYGSRKFKEIEQRNMSIPEKELAGILYGLKLFAYYLTNNKFTIKTDARSLVFLKRFKTCNSKIARSAIWLQEFDFDIVHLSRKTGNTMAIADCLSRAHESKSKLEGYKALRNPELDKWPDIKLPNNCHYSEFDQVADQFLLDNPIEAQTINWVSEEAPPPVPSSTTKIDQIHSIDHLASPEHRILHVSLIDACMTPKEFSQIQKEDDVVLKLRNGVDDSVDSNYTLVKDVLMKKTEEGLRIVVPESFQKELIKYHHGSFWANHIGTKKLYASLSRYYYWPNMLKMVKATVQACKICQYVKPHTVGGVGLGKSKTPTQPNQLVAFDVITGMPRSSKGHNCILVIVDDFTKYALAIEMRDKTAQSICNAFMSYWCRMMGFPRQLHSDEGTEVDSSLMLSVCELLEIRKSHTPIYNPKSDGSVERLNQAIGNMIQTYVTETNKDKWHILLPFMVSGYNNVVHTATGYTPAELLFGHNTSYNMVPLVNFENELLDKSEYLKTLREGQEIKWQIVHKRLEQLKENRINRSSQKQHDYQIGDYVLLKDLTPKVAKTADDKGTKYHKRYKGPFRIIQKYPQTLMIVHWNENLPEDFHKYKYSHQGDIKKRNILCVHPNQVKPFIGKVEREPVISDDAINKFLSDLGLEATSKEAVDRSERTRYSLRSKSDTFINALFVNKRKKKRRYFPLDYDSSSSTDDSDFWENPKPSFVLTTPPVKKVLQTKKKVVYKKQPLQTWTATPAALKKHLNKNQSTRSTPPPSTSRAATHGSQDKMPAVGDSTDAENSDDFISADETVDDNPEHSSEENNSTGQPQLTPPLTTETPDINEEEGGVRKRLSADAEDEADNTLTPSATSTFADKSTPAAPLETQVEGHSWSDRDESLEDFPSPADLFDKFEEDDDNETVDISKKKVPTKVTITASNKAAPSASAAAPSQVEVVGTSTRKSTQHQSIQSRIRRAQLIAAQQAASDAKRKNPKKE